MHMETFVVTQKNHKHTHICFKLRSHRYTGYVPLNDKNYLNQILLITNDE